MGPETFVFTSQEPEAEQQHRQPDEAAYRAASEQPEATAQYGQEAAPMEPPSHTSPEATTPPPAAGADHRNRVYTAEEMRQARDGACPYLAALAMGDFEGERRAAERRERIAAEKARIKAEKTAEAADTTDATSTTETDTKPAAQRAEAIAATHKEPTKKPAEKAPSETGHAATHPVETAAPAQQIREANLQHHSAVPSGQRSAGIKPAYADTDQPLRQTNPDIVLAELEHQYAPTEQPDRPAPHAEPTVQQVEAVLDRLIAERRAEAGQPDLPKNQHPEHVVTQEPVAPTTPHSVDKPDVAQFSSTPQPTTKPASAFKRALTFIKPQPTATYAEAPTASMVASQTVDTAAMNYNSITPKTAYEDSSVEPAAPLPTYAEASHSELGQAPGQPTHSIRHPEATPYNATLLFEADTADGTAETTPMPQATVDKLNQTIEQKLEAAPPEALERITEQLERLAAQVADESMPPAELQHICRDSLRELAIALPDDEVEVLARYLAERHQVTPDQARRPNPAYDSQGTAYDDGMHEAKNQAQQAWRSLVGQPTAKAHHATQATSQHTLGRYAVLWHALTHRQPANPRTDSQPSLVAA